MRIVSPLLKHVLYPGLSRSGYLRRSTRRGPVVVTYHGLLPTGYKPQGDSLDGHLIAADAFRSQIRLLKSSYNLISPEQFRLWCTRESGLPRHSVLLTCDDGLLNTLTDMLPIIRELEVPFLFFVTGASTVEGRSMLWHEQIELWRLRLGDKVSLQMPWRKEPYVAHGNEQTRSLWLDLRRRLSSFATKTRDEILEDMRIQIGISEDWQAEYSQNQSLRRRFFVLNREEIRQLANSGMVIGAHTLSHPMLSQMPEEMAFHEISASRTRLKETLGRNVWALAYPFGNAQAVGSREALLAKRAGFTCAFMNVETSDRECFSFPRIHVSTRTGLSEFEAHLSGFHQSIRDKYTAVMGGPVG